MLGNVNHIPRILERKESIGHGGGLQFQGMIKTNCSDGVSADVDSPEGVEIFFGGMYDKSAMGMCIIGCGGWLCMFWR